MTSKFQTFNDPVLIEMVNAASEYVAGLKSGGSGWLSFLGNCGTGKTFLGTLIVEAVHGSKKHWPSFMARMRSSNYNIHESVQDLSNKSGCLLLDEIGLGNDRKDFGLDLLMQVLEARRGRPCVITSNLTLAGLEQVDARIASRLLRSGRVVACETMDYALREKRGA